MLHDNSVIRAESSESIWSVLPIEQISFQLHVECALNAEMHLTILYQDADYIAIDKPPGLLVHRTQLDTQATEFALQMLRDQIGQVVYPCHRLDRPTSGILLFALNPLAHRFAQVQFAEQKVHKEYLAVVRGWTDDSGLIDYDLRSEHNPRTSHPAQTEYTCLRRSQIDFPVGRYPKARLSLLKLHPLTGRTHQLRRHLAHIRHPILGDTRHGDGAQNKFLRQYCGEQRLLLRATRLQIDHPSRAQRLSISAAEDHTFSEILNRLKLSSGPMLPLETG
jgi:tRNA pseudouridine65 synthase